MTNKTRSLQETFIRSSTSVAGRRLSKQSHAHTKRSRKSRFVGRIMRSKSRRIRFSIIGANLALLGVIGLLVVLTSSESTPDSFSRASALGDTEAEATDPMDELSSADIAVNIARAARLPEATSVTNKADTIKTELAIATTDDKVIAKPQIVAEGLKSRKDIQVYTVKKGDTVGSIAQKFGVSSQTIRLSNGLTGDTLEPGTKLLISPVNGIIYTVKSGDTPESLASKYRSSKEKIIVFNDAELTRRFKVGERIVIPDGLSPITPEYNYYAAAYGTGNGYDYGWCTWHAANRRSEIGRPIPNNMGNAISWLGAAQAAGLATGAKPQEGAVVYHLDIGGWGHVAFVEKVNSDGSIKVSDMNYPIWGQVTYRTVKPSQFGSLRFIY